LSNPLYRAIHAKRPVTIHYHSMSSGSNGESERVIVPFALVDTDLL
jgi:predicted DNA-binding transcriptional regulator YafY